MEITVFTEKHNNQTKVKCCHTIFDSALRIFFMAHYDDEMLKFIQLCMESNSEISIKGYTLTVEKFGDMALRFD